MKTPNHRSHEYYVALGKKGSAALIKTLPSIRDTFWPRVKIGSTDECWPWTGYIDRCTGYGLVATAEINPKRPTTTHRVAFYLTYGPIPKGVCVLHKCDNRPCCNPNHLFDGTKKDNTQDMIKKGRAKWLFGEQSPSSKLTESNVIAIRDLHANGRSCKRLSEMFGVCTRNIYDVVNRKIWKHI